MSSTLKDKVALITGGNSGLGKAAALAFAAAGAKVMIAARREAESLAVVDQIHRAGGTAAFTRTDVTVEADIEAAVKATVEKLGRLDCAVNCAGYNEDFWPVHQIDAGVFDRMMAVNVRGTLLSMKHQIRQMLEQGGGSIVNMASIMGLVGAPTAPVYIATKHAVIGMTKVAALGYAKQNIRVNCVAPTIIQGTPMVDAALADHPEIMTPIIADVPMGRPGRTEEVGHALVWLCSDEASFITGATLPIDGGQTAK